MSDKEYYAVKGFNEDSFGYNFVTYEWKGVLKEGRSYKMVQLMGEDGIKAHQCAIRNKILLPEDACSAGDIAAPPCVQYGGCITPAMGTEPVKAKKKRKQGSQVIVGEK